jgi:uncharacterized membrane protein (UPF0127 family)
VNRRRWCSIGSIGSIGLAGAALAVACALALGAGCKTSQRMSPGTSAAEAAPALVSVAAGDGRSVPFRVEIARTEPEREQGLMYREHLAPDAGMLFIFERPGPLTFWMKNTFIPLDMIFIGADRRVVGIVENAEPRTLTARRVPGLSRYVLEINGGLSAKLGIQTGSAVAFNGVD